IFGCPAYAHVNNGKLVPRAQNALLLAMSLQKVKTIKEGISEVEPIRFKARLQLEVKTVFLHGDLYDITS
ncbi:hypothetical protein ACJX0J_008243, partial [Zea mays]